MKLTPRLTLIFILYAAALLSVVGLLAYYSGRNSLRLATISELSATAIEKQAALNQWAGEKQGDIAALSADPALIEEASMLMAASSNSPEAQTAHDKFLAEVEPRVAAGEFLVVMLIDPQTGEVIAATDPGEEGKFQEDRPFFIHGRDAPYVQNVYYSATLQGPAMTASAPLKGTNGQLLGVLAGRIDLEEMNSIINRRSGLRQTDDAFLVNTSSLFVTQPHLIADPAVLQRGIHTEAVNRCLTQASGTTKADDYRGVPALIVYRWMPERELCLIVKIDQAEAFAPARAFGGTVAAISALALVVAALLAVALARSLTRPILALQAGASRFGRGELATKLPEASLDELGELAHEFNQMAATLSEKESQLRAYSFELEKRVQERTEELRRSNADLEQFAYVASHDLQEPLRMVSSYMQLLEKRYKGRLDSDADEFIGFAVNGSSRMQSLINDLLSYSRVGTRGRAFESVACDHVLDLALENLQVTIEESGAEFERKPLPTVMGDVTQLVQLFQNLIGNAIKFRGEGQPHIQIAAEPRENEWLLSIRDNGIGMEPQYLERIFIIFQRLHGRDKYPGTGIGLAICKKIVERHGGRIWAESEAGQGSTFYFTFPSTTEGIV